MTLRSPSPILVLGALLTGIVLGVALDRGGPFVAAQVGGAGAAQTAAGESESALLKGTDQEAVYRQLARQYEQFQHVNRTFELVARAVSPSVVHIVAQKTSRNDETPRVRHYEETGSGVIVRGDRGRLVYVLTNNHVIEGSTPSKISVFLKDGRAIHPARFWLDAKADIAVLDLNRDDLPAARLGNSDEIEVGSWVMALGSPFGLTHSVSQGIISARGRHMDELQDVENQDFLQTDAAINPGNSGGPLVNMKGEVIGINNSIASNGGGNEGVGFSIPINLARWIMNELIAHGRVSRGALGIYLHPEFRPEDAQALGLKRPQGAWVDVVHQASPAAEAGLRDGDVILRFNQTDVRDLNHLINMVSMAPIGQAAELLVWRNGQQMSVSVKVGSRERTASSPSTTERASAKGLLRRPDRPGDSSYYAMGLELATLDEAAARRYQLPETLRGAVVFKVTPDSPLAPHFQALDVISSVDGQGVLSAEAAARAINQRSSDLPLVIAFDRVVKGVIERRSIRVP